MTPGTGFSALRRLAREGVQSVQERCDLCGEGIAEEHRHLLEMSSRQILCACRACSILFGSTAAGAGARRLVPDRVRLLTDFEVTDAEWEDLRIPVNMAFFCRSGETGPVNALYPSPMGPTEALLPAEAWADLEMRNPILLRMEPDVEALLANRIRSAREYYLVPIDECYKLTGLIRIHWKGLGGGPDVWREIAAFFASLKERARPVGVRDA